MNCDQVAKLLTDDLGAAFEPEVRAHLWACPRCRTLRAHLESLQDLNRVLAGGLRAPEGFSELVIASLQRRRRLRRVKVSLASLAVLVLVLLLSRQGAGPGGKTLSLQPARPKPAAVAPSLGYSGFLPVTAPVSRLVSRPDDSYLEVVVDDLTGRMKVIRVPRRIEVRRTGARLDDLTRVSH